MPIDMSRRTILLAIPLTLACDTGARDDHASDEARAVSAVTAELVTRVEGLMGPEAVKYDAEQDVYFVANFGPPAEEQRDGNGFISRVGPEGAIEELRFAVGTEDQPLHMARGMALQGDTLWVADVDGIHGFHRMSGEPLAFVDFRSFEPGFLNDIDTDPEGRLHVTDTGRGRVYRVTEEGPEIAVEDDRTGPPNGITWDAEREAFLLAPWGGGQVIRAWSPSSGFSDVATLDGGNFDGIELVGDWLLVASQSDSTLWVVDGSEPRPAARLEGTPADIAVDVDRRRVAIPYISRNLVEIWRLPGMGAGR